MKHLLISPFAQLLRNGKENPKNYPYWEEVLNLLGSDVKTTQIGTSLNRPLKGISEFKKDLKFTEIAKLVEECDLWASVDSFLPHLNDYYAKKKGVVIFSQSNPDIYGYKYNNNLLKGKKYLKLDQFLIWEQCEYNNNAFVEPDIVAKAIIRGLELH